MCASALNESMSICTFCVGGMVSASVCGEGINVCESECVIMFKLMWECVQINMSSCK